MRGTAWDSPSDLDRPSLLEGIDGTGMMPSWGRPASSARGAPYNNREQQSYTHTQVPSLWDQAIGKQVSVILDGRDVVPPSVPLTTI